MFFRLTFQIEPVPFLIQSQTVDSKTDSGEIFTGNYFEGGSWLIIYQIDIPVIITDDTENITKVDLMVGNKPEVESQFKIFWKTK